MLTNCHTSLWSICRFLRNPLSSSSNKGKTLHSNIILHLLMFYLLHFWFWYDVCFQIGCAPLMSTIFVYHCAHLMSTISVHLCCRRMVHNLHNCTHIIISIHVFQKTLYLQKNEVQKENPRGPYIEQEDTRNKHKDLIAQGFLDSLQQSSEIWITKNMSKGVVGPTLAVAQLPVTFWTDRDSCSRVSICCNHTFYPSFLANSFPAKSSNVIFRVSTEPLFTSSPRAPRMSSMLPAVQTSPDDPQLGVDYYTHHSVPPPRLSHTIRDT